MGFSDQESVTKRIDALLTRDYHGDEVTKDLCLQLARWARRYWPGHDEPAFLATIAEHMAAQSDALREAAGKQSEATARPSTSAAVAALRAELDRPLKK